MPLVRTASSRVGVSFLSGGCQLPLTFTTVKSVQTLKEFTPVLGQGNT
jgi:hypothetical protein